VSEHAARQGFGSPGIGLGLREATRKATGYWWVSLVSGIAWLVISLVILQFDAASVTTVGVLVGFVFAFAAIQSFALTSVGGATRWVSAIFGGCSSSLR
jgi:uncharacterized membrane protein HdeD (DUF308 family)